MTPGSIMSQHYAPSRFMGFLRIPTPANIDQHLLALAESIANARLTPKHRLIEPDKYTHEVFGRDVEAKELINAVRAFGDGPLLYLSLLRRVSANPRWSCVRLRSSSWKGFRMRESQALAF